jgi:hypothetical protein
VEGLKKNKRLERKKNNPKKETPKVVPAPSEKKVWKAHEEAPKSTTAPTMKKKKVWMPKQKETPVLTPPSTEHPSSSKQ